MMFKEDRARALEESRLCIEFELTDTIREQGRVILCSEVLERIRSDH